MRLGRRSAEKDRMGGYGFLITLLGRADEVTVGLQTKVATLALWPA